MAPVLPTEELSPPGIAQASVIWLHGLGADGHDFVPIVPELKLPPELSVRFVFPHAPAIPVTINGGMVMPAWYDIRSLELENRHDEAGVRASADELTSLIARENERGVPAERILLAGFSQGGAIASHVALRHPERLAGLIALSTYLVCGASLEAERSPANDGLAVFQAHGTADPMVRYVRGRQLREKLEEIGCQVEWYEYPMGHEVCLSEIRALGGWIAQRLG